MDLWEHLQKRQINQEMKSRDVMQQRQSVSTTSQPFVTIIAVLKRNNALWSVCNNEICYKTEFLTSISKKKRIYINLKMLSLKAEYFVLF